MHRHRRYRITRKKAFSDIIQAALARLIRFFELAGFINIMR